MGEGGLNGGGTSRPAHGRSSPSESEDEVGAAKGDLPERLVVIGASAGGVTAMLELAPRLPPDFPAPILLVQHIGAHPSRLAELLDARGPNRAVSAEQDMVPQKGTIYVAPPDHHITVEAGRIMVSHGPKENHTRPAIDPLFRTAALSLGPRVIGVILTGMLDDGTAGLRAIKDCGGLAVVQDPRDAREPSMPQSALANVAVDHVVPLSAMPSLLHRLSLQPPGPSVATQAQAAQKVRLEQLVASGVNPMDILRKIGRPSTFTCPDCGGVLFEIDGARPVRFRCHTGHAFTLLTLVSVLDDTTDITLWTSLRALQEKENGLRRLAEMQQTYTSSAAQDSLVKASLAQADAIAQTSDTLRALITTWPTAGGAEPLYQPDPDAGRGGDKP